MKIYTKTGDAGETSLLGGTRVKKSHIRIEAYGTIDELNAFMGHLADHLPQPDRKTLIQEIQSLLFNIGASLAAEPEKQHLFRPDLETQDISRLETAIDEMNAELPELRNFILPGGHPAVSACHLARVVCRRAERNCIHLAEREDVAPLIIMFLNRLSDYLFVLGRMVAYELGVEERLWMPRGQMK